MFKNWDVTKIVLAAAVIILIILKIQSCNNTNRIKQENLQNAEALKKEITTERNKNGELTYKVAAYVTDKNTITEYSLSLQKEIENLKKKKASVVVQVGGQYENAQPIVIQNNLTELGNDKYSLNWNFVSDDSIRAIQGSTWFKAKMSELNKLIITPDSTIITKDFLKINLVVGVAKNKETGFEEIFVNPKNENIKITSLEGAVLNRPKDKKYAISLNLGYGLSYNAKQNVLSLSPSLSIGLSRAIFKF